MLPAIEAGTLHERVTLLAPKASRNEFNEEIESWAEVATVWGNVSPLAGAELFQSAQVRPDVTTKVTIRYYPGVDSSWRVVAGGKRLDVVWVKDEDSKRVKLELFCRGVGTGV